MEEYAGFLIFRYQWPQTNKLKADTGRQLYNNNSQRTKNVLRNRRLFLRMLDQTIATSSNSKQHSNTQDRNWKNPNHSSYAICAPELSWNFLKLLRKKNLTLHNRPHITEKKINYYRQIIIIITKVAILQYYVFKTSLDHVIVSFLLFFFSYTSCRFLHV